ncbi:MAG: glycosyltransferase family 39 protein [Candidatus Eisenbacteria bacterium]
MSRPDRTAFWFPLLLFIAGLVAFGWNRDLKFVWWDEFLWYPEVLRVARESLPHGDIAALLHPTAWQYPPLFFLVAGGVVKILGESFFAYRALSILASALLALWAYGIARERGGNRAGMLAGYLALTFPLAHRFGAALLVDPFQAALVGGALFLFVRAESRRTSLRGAAIVTALAGATKYTSFILPAAVLLVLLHDRLRSGPEEEKRTWGEIAFFGVVSFFPLLFLRLEDVRLLREMTFWRSLPLDWADLGRLVPPTLPLLALGAPLLRGRFPRSFRAPWLFLLLWTLFFLWRRQHQQMNWFLPAAVPLAALASWTLMVGAASRMRFLASLAAAATVLYGGHRSWVEIRDYRERERIYTEATAFVNEMTSAEGLVVVDALPFKSPLYVRPRTIDVRHGDPEEGEYAILVPWVYDNFRIRGLRGGAWGEVREDAIRESWVLEKEYEVEGERVLEVWRNPRKARAEEE